LLDQEQLGKGANEAQRLILEKVLDSNEVEGEPGGGFGDAPQ